LSHEREKGKDLTSVHFREGIKGRGPAVRGNNRCPALILKKTPGKKGIGRWLPARYRKRKTPAKIEGLIGSFQYWEQT